jgi:uncharacterized protein DUF3995
VPAARLFTSTAASGLAAIAAVHLAWAAGSAWPLESRAALADAVIGRAEGEVPPPRDCAAVAALLAIAASLVAGRPRRWPTLRRRGVQAVSLSLAGRGAAGLSGRTELLSPGSCSPRFRELDRRLYSPLCLALALCSLPAARRGAAAPSEQR